MSGRMGGGGGVRVGGAGHLGLSQVGHANQLTYCAAIEPHGTAGRLEEVWG